jgi:hypothetical protein
MTTHEYELFSAKEKVLIEILEKILIQLIGINRAVDIELK